MHRTAWLAFVSFALVAGCSPSPDGARSDALDETSDDSSSTVALPPQAQLSAESRAALDRSRLPVLLPRDPVLLEDVLVLEGPNFVAWSANVDDLSISLHGTDYRWPLVEDEPPPPATDQVRGHVAVVSTNEGIRTATWDEAGVAWALDIECARPSEDARCLDEDHIRALAETLELVGGAQ